MEKRAMHKPQEGGNRWELFIDGASRNNPGPAGAGIYLLKDGVPIEEKGFYLGVRTNNQAEYLALVLGAYYAQKYIDQKDILVINADSELLVRQLTGIYKIKNEQLARLYKVAAILLDGVRYSIHHVRREQNHIADKLANMGIDKKIKVPKDILDKMAVVV